MSRVALISPTSTAAASALASPPEPRRSWVLALVNAGWLMTSRLGGDALSFVLILVLSRQFGPAGLGQYVYGFAVGSFAQALVQLGLEDYGMRECARLAVEAQRALLSKLLTIQLVMAILVSGGVVGFLVLTEPSADTAAIVLVLTTVQLAFVLARTLFVPAFARQQMAEPAAIEVVCRVTGMCGGIVLVIVFHTPLVLALMPLPIAHLIMLALAFRSASRHLGSVDLSVDLRAWADIVWATWPFAAAFVVFQVNSRVEVLALSLSAGEETTGIYSAAGKLLESGSMPLFFLGLAAYPGLSQLATRSERPLIEAARHFVVQCLLAGALLTWGLFYFAPLVVVPLLGDRFTTSIPTVKMMAPLGLLAALEVAGMRLLLAWHLQVRRLKLQLVGAVAKTLLVVLLVPAFGIPGAVIASISALVLLNVLYLGALRGHPLHHVYTRALGQMGLWIVAAGISGALAIAWSSYEWVSAVVSLVAMLLAAVVTGLLPLRMWWNRFVWRR